MERLVYKVLRRHEWHDAQAQGVFRGSADDARDGFIHLSTAAQVRGTLERHFARDADLVVLELEAGTLGPSLKWEASRGGALFPHFYDALPLAMVTRTVALAHSAHRSHDLPPEFP